MPDLMPGCKKDQHALHKDNNSLPFPVSPFQKAEAMGLVTGLSITGHGKPDALLRKGGLQAGETLVLTKALGTGVIMAASMRGKAKGRWVIEVAASMQQSNAPAARCLARHGATGCTDVTGFGLLGHLAEMARASQVGLSS